jgi:hypothetical protein
MRYAKIEGNKIVKVLSLTLDDPVPDDSHIVVPENVEYTCAMDLCRLYYWNGTAIVRRPEVEGDYYNWGANGWELDSERLFHKIRQERNNLMGRSDWTQIPDAPLTEEKKTEWQVYRQQLRDFPADNADAINFNRLTWPTKPT